MPCKLADLGLNRAWVSYGNLRLTSEETQMPSKRFRPSAVLFGAILAVFASGACSAQTIVAVHSLKVGDCVQYSDWNGLHAGTITKPEYAGGYQVNGNGVLFQVGANSRDIKLCPPGVTDTSAAATPTPEAPPNTAHPAPGPAAPLAAHPAVHAAAAQTGAKGQNFKVGDCIQFAYGNGWETGTIAQLKVAGAYQVNWGSIVVPANGDPKYFRACPAGAGTAQAAAETKAAMNKLPKGNGIGAQYGTRTPATCSNRKAPITVATARMYLACDIEGDSSDTLTLITDLVVQVGSARPFNYNQDSSAVGIDARQPVYDIHGSYTRYQCALLSERLNDFAKTHNCFKYPAVPGYDERCYTDAFGDHHQTPIATPQCSVPGGYGRCYTDTFGDHHCEMTGGGRTQFKDKMPPSGN